MLSHVVVVDTDVDGADIVVVLSRYGRVVAAEPAHFGSVSAFPHRGKLSLLGARVPVILPTGAEVVYALILSATSSIPTLWIGIKNETPTAGGHRWAGVAVALAAATVGEELAAAGVELEVVLALDAKEDAEEVEDVEDVDTVTVAAAGPDDSVMATFRMSQASN